MRYASSALFFLALSTACCSADSFSDAEGPVLDDLPEAQLAQIKAYNAKVREDVGRGIALASVAWKKPELTVAFFEGSKDLHEIIESTAEEWTAALPVKAIRFSFRNADGTFRTWSPSDSKASADIRIGFSGARGYWSQIGLINTLVPAGSPTMYFDNFHKLLESQTLAQLRAGWPSSYLKSVVLHEFGHALGFAHEQFHADCQKDFQWDPDPGYVELLVQVPGDSKPAPAPGCDQRIRPRRSATNPDAFDSPGVFLFFRYYPNCWSEEKTAFQFSRTFYLEKTAKTAKRIEGVLMAPPDETPKADRHSIMLYDLPDFLFKSRGTSACYTGQNKPTTYATTLSDEDKAMIRRMYHK